MCMGKTHATSGVTAALGYTAAGLPLAPTSLTGVVAFATVTAGAALWPDWDHPSASAARSWGFVSRLVSRLVVRVFGPHRHGAHGLLTAVGAGALAGVAGGLGGLWPVVIVFLAASLAIGVLWRSGGSRNELLGAALATGVFFGEIETQWLGVAIGVGMLAHIAGDKLTPEGMALYWPISRKMRPGLGLFTTDTWGERLLLWGLRLGNVVLFVAVSGYWAEAVGTARETWPYVAEIGQRATGFA